MPSLMFFWDHPRVCGEKSRSWLFSASRSGSPPRVRGKVGCGQRWSSLAGITPACAGKRYPDFVQRTGYGDHPRVCGEKALSSWLSSSSPGSPPRVRGKASPVRFSGSSSGITPACAGKRTVMCSPSWLRRDHPRVCGEKADEREPVVRPSGSPPRVRGKDRHLCDAVRREGITPACAGKRLKHIPYLLCSCAKHLFTPQFCVDNLCQLAVGHSAVSLNIR